MADKTVLDRNLALEVVRVTEAAALSASRLMGRGDEKAADQAAVDAMRRALNSLAIDGVVVIGEGERDEAPMLYIGEKVGMGGGPRVDIALDPLEGTTLTAKGGPNALAVIAMAEAGGFLNAPAAACRSISSTSTPRRRRTSRRWRRPRSARSPTSWSASSTGRAMSSRCGRSARPARASC